MYKVQSCVFDTGKPALPNVSQERGLLSSMRLPGLYTSVFCCRLGIIHYIHLSLSLQTSVNVTSKYLAPETIAFKGDTYLNEN